MVSERLAGSWKFSPIHSTAEFSVKYLVANFRSRFQELDVSLSDGQLSGTAKVDSLAIGFEPFIGHLKAPDFFDAENHPELTFRSTDIAVDGDGITLTGELTIRGVTKPITATGTIGGPTEDFAGSTRLGFDFETTIDRTDYGLEWNAPLPGGGKALGDDVTLTVSLEFSQQQG
jgi:polyisoprenoid-binding protein YceI